MRLETLAPDPAFDASAHVETIATFHSVAEDITVRVWGGDWCKDCRAQLPAFGAVLVEAGIDLDDVEQYPVEKLDDGTKEGPLVDEYDIERIPTIVIEANGSELARYVESADRPAAEYLAERLSTTLSEV